VRKTGGPRVEGLQAKKGGRLMNRSRKIKEFHLNGVKKGGKKNTDGEERKVAGTGPVKSPSGKRKG